MPRDGAIIFRDIVGKLAVLRITCDKCGRSGQYRVDRLIIRYGIVRFTPIATDTRTSQIRSSVPVTEVRTEAPKTALVDPSPGGAHNHFNFHFDSAVRGATKRSPIEGPELVWRRAILDMSV